MQLQPTLRKVRADSPEAGRYGRDIARGPNVWLAFDGSVLIAMAATRKEAIREYKKAWLADVRTRQAVTGCICPSISWG